MADNDQNTLTGKRILVVEDNAINMDVASSALGLAGAMIDSAVDGEQALHLIARTKYDLVLLDLTLPGMNGVAIGKVIRTSQENSDVPIVLFTAADGRQTENAARDVRAQALVKKPVDVEELINIVSRHAG